VKRWLALLSVAAGALGHLFYGPIPETDPRAHLSRTITDRNGVVLYEPLSLRGNRAEWIARVPPHVAHATIAAEDRRFAWHIGIDPLAVTRALWHDLRRGALVEGGSTITQQVAKLLCAEPGAVRRRGFLQKGREAIIALRLERRYTKGAILALYVNLAPYGSQIDGIARASRAWFGVAPEELTPAQAAFLAALPRRPGSVQEALRRQKTILRRMDAPSSAFAERLRFDRGSRPLVAQHFVERVIERCDARRITTKLDARLQRTVQGIISAHRRDLLAHGAHSVAVVVLDNASGEWLAWEGSGDYAGDRFGGAIDGVVALRQPGSAIKPFTYALAFEEGFTPASVLPDVPSSFPTAEEGIVYTPRNYDGRYRGPLRARAALAGSENVPAVALLSRVGTPAFLRLLRNAGFSHLTKTADYYGLGLTLGDAEVRLDELVAAYSLFARGGIYREPRMIRSPAVPQRTARVVSPRTAFWITDILSDAAAREFIFGSGGSLDFPFPVAVKTGTSQAYHDNWTVGYTREVTVGVWVGNFDRQPLRNSSGVTGAGPLFHDVMLAARAAGAGEREIAVPPPDVERAPVCLLSGLRPSTACPAVGSEWVAREAPVVFCSWHHGDTVAWPEEYRPWAESQEAQRPRAVVASRRLQRDGTLRVVNPPDGATYLIDPTLRPEYQSIEFRARGGAAAAWSVDGRHVGRSWPLAPGRHTVTAADAYGNRDSVRIHVK
jgi:penicillin-binding protein 1C